MLIEAYRSAQFDTRQPYRLASLHNHTTLSDGKATYQQLLGMAVTVGINIVAITDHDNVLGGLLARELALKKGFAIEVIPGSEITIKGGGHLLGLGLEKDILPSLPLAETIVLIHEQGGIAIAPHPFYRRLQANSLGLSNMEYIAGEGGVGNRLDGVEILNGGVRAMRGSSDNERALLFYLGHLANLGAAIGAPDTHNLEVDSVLTAVQGESLIEGIRQGRTAIFYQDRQTRQNRMNAAVDVMGSDFFTNVPLFIKRRINQQRGRVEVCVAQTDNISDTEAGGFLTISELNRFKGLREQRRNAWFSSRVALKMAYIGYTGQGMEVMRFLSVANKIFGNSKNGPPFIEHGEDLHYSLAHSGDMGVGAVSDALIGVDLERVNHLRPPKISLLKDDEIIQESQMNPELDLHEIGQKRGSIREAVGKGLLIGLSRELSFNISQESADGYRVEPVRNGVVFPSWRVDVVKMGEYFLTIATMGIANSRVNINQLII